MTSIEFKEQNVIFAKDQEEYANLPAFAQENGMVTAGWQLESEEITKISKEKCVRITVLNFGRPVQNLSVRVTKPKFPVTHKLQTQSNPESWDEENGTATFVFKLTDLSIRSLKKNKILWITTITHGAALQPMSGTLI